MVCSAFAIYPLYLICGISQHIFVILYRICRSLFILNKSQGCFWVDLYNRIDELCKGKGLSIYKVCKLANISFSVIYDLKSGKKVDLNRKTAEKLATALEITVDELYGKEKTPDAEAPRDSQYNEIFNLFYGLSEDNVSLAVKGLAYLVKIPDEKLPEAVRYLQFLADTAGN